MTRKGITSRVPIQVFPPFLSIKNLQSQEIDRLRKKSLNFSLSFYFCFTRHPSPPLPSPPSMTRTIFPEKSFRPGFSPIFVETLFLCYCFSAVKGLGERKRRRIEGIERNERSPSLTRLVLVRRGEKIRWRRDSRREETCPKKSKKMMMMMVTLRQTRFFVFLRLFLFFLREAGKDLCWLGQP